ncbi:winged helix-turn-helix domain-containing protein [Haloarchaeobius sp. HME9146]|uniref:winged helix-turn-helix domain-containing protein n=1 Tax=Haloarchaeobius sp. HME9146 TaxID=2978732 RepID=UPI0021C070D1|nr:winged helix-turn-helix domain-containing protein [Haloarchaeobius sp. HME9146]MCT9098176.1 winged helix-turn-helix domain-containing protein [Haloarchaeobius sp. HME9146]
MIRAMTGAGRKPTVTDIEILQQFVRSPDPVLHPTELTETLDMSRQGVYKRLEKLVDDGALSSKKVAGTRIFWITDAGREQATAEKKQ